MKSTLIGLLERRILVLDGAMGTMLQQLGLQEEDFRGALFANHPRRLKGNYDMLVLTHPELIAAIHRDYLTAGADITKTNTFNATAISQADYGMQGWVEQINLEGVRIARSIADEFTALDPAKPRFVAGVIGPTGRAASALPGAGSRPIALPDLVEAYSQQVRALVEGGADILLVETVFDVLNARAALRAISNVLGALHRDVPVMVSATVADARGCLPSGQTLDAFLEAVRHYPLLSVGLNCSSGAEQLLPHLRALSAQSGFRVSVHPSAGLPSPLGQYGHSAAQVAEAVEEMLRLGLVNLVGGCCGTTPRHIERIAQLVGGYRPRPLPAAPG